MHVSLNELTSLSRRALEGVGFPPGEFEDAADMIVWLEQFGLGGTKLLAKTLPRLTTEQWPAVQKLYDDGGGCVVLQIENGSLLQGGSLAADMACTRALADGLGIVRLSGCRDRGFILGYLARCARRGYHMTAMWCVGEPRRAIQNVATATGHPTLPTIRRYRADGGGEQMADTHTLTLIATRDFALMPARDPAANAFELLEEITPNELAARSRLAWDQGVDVDPDLWSKLQTLAAVKLVEATPESRARGAGDTRQ